MSTNRRPFVLLGLGGLILALAVLITPIYVMRPFRPQGPDELVVALWVMRLGPWLLAAAGVLAITAVMRAWPGGWGRRLGATLMLLVTSAAGGLSQINVFETMFAPLPSPRFAATGAAGLPGEAIVMAVRVGEAARAYPVEVMAYHHVLNDVVGDTPLVVTY
jgi:hypothetical protein